MGSSHSPFSGLKHFLNGEAGGGILLMAAAALAMLIANSPFAQLYFHGLHSPIGPWPLIEWINDALMALFFLLVGLEIKHEFVEGRLSTWSARALPIIAAAGGMALPALFYLAVIGGEPGLERGWAIPAATDIAFAIGVMALLGRRVPTSLKLFLTTVAIVDDLGAAAIIAFVYTAKIDALALLAAALVMGGMFALNRLRVVALWPYLLLSALLWLAVLLSGVHATIAGVLAACLIPIRGRPRGGRPGEGMAGAGSPLKRLEQGLHPWVTYLIVPVFGFANAGVSFAGAGEEIAASPLPLAIAAGLFLGKQAGVFAALWLCVRLGISPKPRDASWPQIYGACLLCGIGFTMSLFIGGIAFADPALMDEVRIGVLGGSLLSATAGYLLLYWAGERRGRNAG